MREKVIALVLSLAMVSSGAINTLAEDNGNEIGQENTISEEKNNENEAVIDSGKCGNDATWTLTGENENLTLTITGTGRAEGGGWNEYNDQIKNLIVEEGISEIGGWMFNDMGGIINVQLPKTMDRIMYSAFMGCESLTEITIPEGVTCIESNTFSGCSNLMLVTFPESVECIEEYAFSNCGSVKEIILPESITSIKAGGFFGCVGLTKVKMPNEISFLGERVFEGCSNLEEISIPKGITTVPECLFLDCISLEKVTIQENITIIADGAFMRCKGLDSVVLPKELTSIEANAFNGCSSLSSVTFQGRVAHIGDHAFMYCNQLEKIELPYGLCSIGQRAFVECGLSDISIPDTVDEIGEDAFDTTVRLHFEGSLCDFLSKATVGGEFRNYSKNFAEGDGHSFDEPNIVREGTASEAGEVVYTCKKCGEHYSFGYYSESNKASIANYSGRYFTEIKIPTTIDDYEVIRINEEAFSWNDELINVELPESLITIGYGAFQYCENLREIKIPDGVNTIENHAFSGCRNLERVMLPEDVGGIDHHAFSGCVSLKEVILPKGMRTVEQGTFFNCEKLELVTFPNGLNEIGSNAFYGCNSLKEIALPKSVDTILWQAFHECHNLSSVTIMNKDAYVQEAAFGLGYSNVYGKNLPIDGFMLYCYPGSTAERYAKENEISYTLLEVPSVPIVPEKVSIPPGKTLTYTGKPQIGVVASNKYRIKDNSATSAGNYKATLTLNDKKKYTWSDGTTTDKTVVWRINSKAITPSVTLSGTSFAWNGRSRIPSVIVKDGSAKLDSSNYTVTYKNNKNVGTASVAVTMKGNYRGSKSVAFIINPKGTAVKGLRNASKAITVKWSKQSSKMPSRITGYQIQLATNSKFSKNRKTVNVTGYNKTSKKIKGLGGKKKYYVRIRTYKTIGKKKHYSAWSKVKTVTTKK